VTPQVVSDDRSAVQNIVSKASDRKNAIKPRSISNLFFFEKNSRGRGGVLTANLASRRAIDVRL